MKILNFGSINIDHVYSLPHLVREGETLASTAYRKNEGGKGLNQSIALAKAGAEVYHAGAIGQDGRFLLAFLEQMGVRTQYVEVIDETTGHAMIQVDEAGHNSIVLYGGANQKVDVPMIDRVISRFETGDCLLLQNEISGTAELIVRAKARGMQVALNPSPITPALLGYPLDKVDWLILNEIEGGELTGERDPGRMLDALIARFPRCRVVLTLGEQGAVYADAQRRVSQAAVRTQAVDTTAAGDTFTGYFLSGALGGQEISRALYQAAVAAAIAVSRPGAGRSIPCREEVLAACAGKRETPA